MASAAMSDDDTTPSPPSQQPRKGGAAAAGFEVVVGTSRHANDAELVDRVVQLVIESYAAVGGHKTISAEKVRGRLRCGDVEATTARRVLHLAIRDGRAVGCMSSSLTTPWTPTGCGHWGFLVVAVDAQGTGVASALVQGAETRLKRGGCTEVQIEYEYGAHLPHTQRLSDWYEGKLGFKDTSCWFMNRFLGMIVGGGGTEFRRCRKAL